MAAPGADKLVLAKPNTFMNVSGHRSPHWPVLLRRAGARGRGARRARHPVRHGEAEDGRRPRRTQRRARRGARAHDARVPARARGDRAPARRQDPPIGCCPRSGRTSGRTCRSSSRMPPMRSSCWWTRAPGRAAEAPRAPLSGRAIRRGACESGGTPDGERDQHDGGEDHDAEHGEHERGDPEPRPCRRRIAMMPRTSAATPNTVPVQNDSSAHST